MKNNPRYTFGNRIFVKNEEAEVLGIWRARGVWYYKVQSRSKSPNIDALWWLETHAEKGLKFSNAVVPCKQLH